jgi:acetylornithine deacetylase/succinyl-diaminopimelate desuccinylase-like protein
VELLRIDTTNPPGNEEEACRVVAARLAEVGLPCEVLDAAPGRRNLAAGLGPQEEALIFSAHLDVVPADPAHWTHPPFGAVQADGCIWGRGAIDMKHMAAYALAVLRQLARSGARPRKGLRVVLFADEEAGCAQGSLYVARHRPHWLKGAVGLTEVGAFTTWIEGQRVYPIQVAEKGFVWLRLRIQGSPGHGSMPHNDNPLLHLAHILDQLGRQPFPFQCTQPVADFLDAVAKILGFPKGHVFRAIGARGLSSVVLNRVVRDPARQRPLAALLRNTVAPTMVRAGTKSNVIPSDAELVVDCRILPGTDPVAFVEEFRRRIEGPYTLEVIQSGPPVVMDRHHPILGVIASVLATADPGSHCVPNMLSGFTDARAFAEVGTPCFGFAPVWLPPDLPFAPMFHGHNERIPVDGFRWGLSTVWELVRRVCLA